MTTWETTTKRRPFRDPAGAGPGRGRDEELAQDISWSMELEGRKISPGAERKLREKIAADRAAREPGAEQ